jgi:hypothetical protein
MPTFTERPVSTRTTATGHATGCRELVVHINRKCLTSVIGGAHGAGDTGQS